MVKKFFTFIYLFIIIIGPTSVTAETSSVINIDDIIKYGLPVISVTTLEDRFPTYDVVSAPEGCIGTTITNAEKLPGSIVRIEPDGTVSYNSGEYVDSESGMTIRIRGNGSALRYKKPFKIKLQKKGDLLVRGDEDKRDKSWILMMDRDRKHVTGHLVNSLLGLSWTPSWEFVNFIYNGEYQGLYLLVEAPDRNEKCKLNVSKSGFIIEHDAYWYKKPEESYASNYTGPRYAYTYKWPDYEDLEFSQLEYINQTIAEYEASMTESYYPDLIDVVSLGRWVLGQDILGNGDTGGSNRFFCKYDDTPASKLYMGNLWDFDGNEELKAGLTIFHTYFFKEMFYNTKNQALLRAYIDAYDQLADHIFDTLDAHFGAQLAVGDESYDKSASLDHERWNWDVPIDYKYTAQRQKLYYSDRRNILKSELDNLRKTLKPATVSEITDSDAKICVNGFELTVTDSHGPIEVYSIDGTKIGYGIDNIRLSLPQRGVYIVSICGKTKKIFN